jgi:hypothetical protein
MDNELTVVGYVSDHKMITASCRHFLCNNMIDNKEEVPIEEAYLFSLAPSDPNSPKPTLTCSFAPIECRKTYKLLRTLPTYHPDLDQPFQSEATLHIRSMRELSERKETPSPIVPHTRSRWCRSQSIGFARSARSPSTTTSRYPADHEAHHPPAPPTSSQRVRSVLQSRLPQGNSGSQAQEGTQDHLVSGELEQQQREGGRDGLSDLPRVLLTKITGQQEAHVLLSLHSVLR